jgi:hypothetical protein
MPGVAGLLQGTLSKLDGLNKIYFRLFEIYGKGLPYSDYWTNNEGKTKLNDIYNYLYAYKLDLNTTSKDDMIKINKADVLYGNTPVDKEWAVELYGSQINEYITKVREFKQDGTIGDQNYTAKDRNKSKKEDKLSYLEIGSDVYKDVFQTFKTFTDKIEQIRIDNQRVRETPNNKVSSRSILIYDFVLMINMDGKIKPVNFLIIDLPGREEIAPTFINKYVDNNTNPLFYNIIKTGFENDSRQEITNYKKLFKTDPGETYMKELKLMLGCFTLNPLAVPIFATEIIEKYVKDNYKSGKNLSEIFNKELPRKYILRGEYNGQYTGNTINFETKLSLLDEFYDLNYNEKIFTNDHRFSEPFKTPNENKNDKAIEININDKNITLNTKVIPDSVKSSLSLTEIEAINEDTVVNIFYISRQLFKSKLGWNTFHNLLTMSDNGDIQIEPEISTNDKLLPNVKKWNDSYSQFINPIIKNKRKNKMGDKPLKDSKVNAPYRFPYGLENKKHNGRQIKTLLFINLMKRLFELKRYDILNDLFKTIVDKKINYYLGEYIKNGDNDKCKKLINDLIINNFKREALKEKFGEGTSTIDIKNGMTEITKDVEIKDLYELDDLGLYKKDGTGNLVPLKIKTTLSNYLYESIKYDFYTTGYEGVYINENIIGLIKYLGKDGKKIKDASGKESDFYLIQNQTDRDMIKIDQQNNKNTFSLGIKVANLLQLSRIEEEGKISTSAVQAEKITEYGLRTLLNAKSLNQDVLETEDKNIINNALDISSSRPATDQSSQPAWMKGIASSRLERKGNKGVMFLTPDMFKYNKNKKIKIFDINENNYYNQIFIKNKQAQPEDYMTKWDTVQIIKPEDPISVPQIANVEDYYYNPIALEEAYSKLLNSYTSGKIFCYDQPIIKTILEPYLDIINDFKIFYLFGNYTKATRELKCAQQYELLETTNNFIEAITR